MKQGVVTVELLEKAKEKLMEEKKEPQIIVENGQVKIEEKDAPNAPPKPTEYQRQLMAKWYDSGHRTPAPFASDGKQLFWMNRRERRARAAIARKRAK